MQSILLTGDNYVAIKNRLADITAAFDTRITLDLKEDTLDDLAIAATASSLFADKQVVVVRNPLSISYEKLVDCLEGEVSNQVVLLDSPPQLDKRKKGYKQLQKQVKVELLKQPSERDTVSWVIQTAREHDLALNSSLAHTLVEVAGTDTNHLASEIEKLKLVDQLSEDVIRKHCASPQQMDIFNLLDAIFSGNTAKAEIAVKQYLSSPDADVHYLVSMMSWQLRQAVNVWANEKGGNVKVSPYQARKLLGFVRGKSKIDMQGMVGKVAEFDEMLKTKGHERDVAAEMLLLAQRLTIF